MRNLFSQIWANDQRCLLEIGKTYYVNFVHGNTNDPLQSNCINVSSLSAQDAAALTETAYAHLAPPTGPYGNPAVATNPAQGHCGILMSTDGSQ